MTAMTTATPAAAPSTSPVPPDLREADAGPPGKTWNIVLFIMVSCGVWSEATWYADQPSFAPEKHLKEVLVRRRKFPLAGQFIVAARVPWEQEVRRYDPPLGRID
jgi:hypothetical protein